MSSKKLFPLKRPKSRFRLGVVATQPFLCLPNNFPTFSFSCCLAHSAFYIVTSTAASLPSLCIPKSCAPRFVPAQEIERITSKNPNFSSRC